MSDDVFLTYNRDELCAIASGNDSEKKAWLDEFRLQSAHHWHEFLWKEYEEFRLEYDEPDKNEPIMDI